MEALNDISFAGQIDPTHTNYYSIPWDHIKYSNGGRRGTINMLIRSYFPEKSESEVVEINRYAISYNVYKNKHEQIGETFNYFISHQPMSIESLNTGYNSSYEYESDQKYGRYLRTAYINTMNDPQYVYNDTAVLEEKYLDYYAMDDGTAEFSFGLPGNGGITMRFAQLFTFFSSPQLGPDTLSAVDFYFDKTRNNAHGDIEFTPVIWSYERDTSDVLYPAEILYPKVEDVDGFPRYQPDTTLGFNEFMRVQLEEDILVPDTVFVGFVQYGTDFLSLGYDLSTNNKQNMRFNGGTGWAIPQYSIPAGTVMIRPVFGHKVFNPVRDIQVPEMLNVYPNPARDYFTLPVEQLEGVMDSYTIQIIDVLGKTVYQEVVYSERIDIAGLSSGLFFIRLVNKHTNKIYTQKFIKID